jgi:Fic family protein
MSRGINRTKSEYYRLLQAVRDDGAWEDWIVYILDIVTETSELTLNLIEGIRDQMTYFKQTLRKKHPKVYSQDLINNLFRHPYTRIEYVMKELDVSRPTATSYLEKLATDPDLPIEKVAEGRKNYFINTALVSLLAADK